MSFDPVFFFMQREGFITRSCICTAFGYANLDALAAGTPLLEPLIEWNDIINEVVRKDLPEHEQSSLMKESADLGSLLQDRAVVLAHDLKNQPLSIESMITQERLLRASSPYILWHLVVLILPVTELVSRLAAEAQKINRSKGRTNMTIPHMDEFYDFLQLDRKYVVSRESWS